VHKIVGMEVNNTIANYFRFDKGETRISFVLNIVVGTLAKMIHLAQRNDLVKGLVFGFVDNGMAKMIAISTVFSGTFNCPIGNWSINYIWVLVSRYRLHIAD
jgi:hypothetical protein